MSTVRYLPGLILGAQCYIARFGASVTVDSAVNSVSADFCPELPITTAEGTPWQSLGKIMEAEPQFQNKDIEIEGCDDDLSITVVHGYAKETITMQDKKSYRIVTKYLTQEAFELSHELLASDARPYIDCWLYARHIDTLADAGAQEIFVVCLQVRLKLSGNVRAVSDAAQAEYMADIIRNPLAIASIDGLRDRLNPSI